MLFSKNIKVPDFSGKVDHIAFIMDGNGRWAQKRGLPREAGHKVGAQTFRRVVHHIAEIGIPTVTVYAFSTENWSRPKGEVEAIMALLSAYIDEAREECQKYDISVVFVGDKKRMPEELLSKMEKLESDSAGHRFTLNIALNYGGRREIVDAVNSLIAEGKCEICEEDITSRLYTHPSPMPDLVVRTGGEVRISNFLLWQSAYAEYYFTDTLWPDLTEREIDRALDDFCKRHRRFGGI